MITFSLCLLTISAAPDDWDGMKSSVCVVGDLDKDGVPDAAVASRDWSLPERVWVFSGQSGEVLCTLLGTNDGDGFGNALGTVADIDKDGCRELIVSASGSRTRPSSSTEWKTQRRSEPYTRIYSGKTSRVITELPGVSTAVGIDDLNGDGVPDIICASPPSADRKTCLVRGVSGKDMGELFRLVFDVTTQACQGMSLVSLPDINRDSVADFAVGWPGDLTPKGGHVEIRSGRNGEKLRDLFGSDPSEFFGWTLTCVPSGRIGSPLLVVSAISKYVSMFDLGDFSRLCGVSPLSEATAFGSSIALVGDIDNDQFQDIAIGACPSLSAGATGVLFSGKDCHRIRPMEFASGFGIDVAAIEPVDKETDKWLIASGVKPSTLVAVSPTQVVRVQSLKDGRTIWERNTSSLLAPTKPSSSPK